MEGDRTMKVPFFKMTAKEIAKSKAMLSGIGLIILGGYMIKQGMTEFGYGVILNGFGYIGIRDAK